MNNGITLAQVLQFIKNAGREDLPAIGDAKNERLHEIMHVLLRVKEGDRVAFTDMNGERQEGTVSRIYESKSADIFTLTDRTFNVALQFLTIID